VSKSSTGTFTARGKYCSLICSLEAISKFLFTVTPAKAGVQESLKVLDSGFRRNDARRRLVHFEIVS